MAAGRPRALVCRWAHLATTILVVAAGAPHSGSAQERILAYDSEVLIQEDGSLDVTERITVRAEGSQIRRGIYRDFPTRYRDRYGNRVRVDFEVVSVERNGEPEPWFTERISNGVRLNTGSDDFLPVPAEHTFTLRFRTTRQLGFFDEHDELYWNAIGTGWVFPIGGGSVEVRLPEAVPVGEMGAEGYTGPQGAQRQGYRAALPAPGVARYTLTEPLAPREGLTIVLTFPKGIVDEPTATQRAGWLLADNVGVLVALIGLAGLLFYCVRRWQAVGRDPRKGVVIPRYFVPEGHGPAGLRYLRDMGYDPRCFSSDVLALAVAGQLRIHCDEKFLIKDRWSLERVEPTTPAEPALTTSQRVLLERIFSGGKPSVDLKSANAGRLSAARSGHQQVLDETYHGAYFKRNGGSIAVATLVAVASIMLAFLVSGGNGQPAILAVAALMVAVVIVFAKLVRAPTPEGRKLLDEIEGLVLYLSVAERDELARMRAPGEAPVLDAQRYEALLPYAVALEVEDAWTVKFTAAVGAAAAVEAARRISWYRSDGPVTNLGDLSRSVGSGLNTQIASSSTPPGGSSGSGGGGSSGGGGGGGGGGGR
jgi:uncharacterized membrane protein YgcG